MFRIYHRCASSLKQKLPIRRLTTNSTEETIKKMEETIKTQNAKLTNLEREIENERLWCAGINAFGFVTATATIGLCIGYSLKKLHDY